MLYGEIVFGNPGVAVSGEALSTNSGGASTGTIDNLPVVPGTVVITDGTNTYADNGQGVLTGAPAGTGTVNYSTGAVTITGGAATGNNVVAYQRFSANSAQNLPNSVSPMFASFRAEEAAGGIIVEVGESGADYRVFFQRTFAAYENLSLGLLPQKLIRVWSSAKGRLNGVMANAQ